jgi:putative transposase
MSDSSLGPRPSRPHSYGHHFWHRRGYLPHFDASAVVQSITFRLADSLPRHVYDSIVTSSKTESEQRARIEALIDHGRGAYILRRTDCASIVENALKYFDGDRYKLLA